MTDDKTILDYFFENVEKHGDRVFMTQPMGGGNVKTFTFNETVAEAKKIAGYIQSLGLPEKSQIAICSKNCAWWVITDIAIWMSGHVTVPVFPTLTAEITKYTLEHSESKLLFVGKLDEKPWVEQQNGIPDDLPTVSFPLCPENSAKKTWDEACKEATPLADPVNRTLDEMATIIYTSGSTGKPKGVMTSFKAMTIPTTGIIKTLKISDKDRYLSYLPVSHGMERWLGICIPLYTGMHLYFAESLSTFVNDLNRAKPTLFLSVPRLWTKFQAGVFTKMPEKKLNTLLSIPLINILVKKKILKGLGLDKVRVAGCGSAPMPAQLLTWYLKLGLDLQEGYGMTENFNYSHINRVGQGVPGYVGQPYDDVECRIAEDGEIQVKTPGKMMGYFKNEEATMETITEDGWVRTGDKGEVDSKNRLKITGRTKEIFKTAKGKYVAPAPIENEYISNHLVELACVSGRGYPQPHAIIQLSEKPKADAASGEAERQKIATELEEHMKAVNAKMEAHEKLDFIALVKDDWLPENGFLTPTQKIKRTFIEDTYGGEVDGWYEQKKKVVWHGW
mmetsp:Transcript_26670/g.61347  ORF Transcript_26670/g.61347 Transcript_26670/m.61347 type:complete len:561 (-) Transcript_26670:410-2092(-)|eukprot:CAMPEP_0113315332 /NCGR_PEP_ID=MMETSP0010_2-20120614/11044_1 /TAXON_ID=216773 ORGANISM="Corethron hystrix, Strain 308" /NCGR_SAMPLE_ID=MMETSP0010_2 /ASSEMBLY_ACC=CAM_ASM_000155 /LENGTH=560 /DNA_ID=CAMNT_0000171815 /DNA_START=102 /DNA_END=1784 /DNA_ORIENTATION=+ /assembly_acc=CAM_ASM_000155